MDADELVELPERMETERLVLRPWLEADLPAMAAAIATSVEHLRPWMPWVAAEPLDLDARRELIWGWASSRVTGGDAVYGVFLEDDATPVGGTGLHRRRGPGVLEIGYWIHVDHLRRGYATELVRGLTAAGLALPSIERVEIHHDRANVASGGVPPKVGYERTGEGPRPDFVPAAPADSGTDVSWTMTRERWAALRA